LGTFEFTFKDFRCFSDESIQVVLLMVSSRGTMSLLSTLYNFGTGFPNLKIELKVKEEMCRLRGMSLICILPFISPFLQKSTSMSLSIESCFVNVYTSSRTKMIWTPFICSTPCSGYCFYSHLWKNHWGYSHEGRDFKFFP